MNGKSSGIAWNDIYKLGNEQVDLQHKKLFELVNDLIASCTNGSDLAKLSDTLNFLVNYTIRHFHYEEELQLRHNYPEYDSHKKLHEEFKKTVGELVARFHENGSSARLSADINKVVIRWLISHIQREDKKIGAFIRSKQ